jgi:hypothetical protein
MADDQTQTLNGDSTPEDRILARLDAIDARLATLEAQAEERTRETRPIWEKALAEILNVGQDVKAMSTKLDVLADDVLAVRAKQREADARLRELEAQLHRA